MRDRMEGFREEEDSGADRSFIGLIRMATDGAPLRGLMIEYGNGVRITIRFPAQPEPEAAE